MDPITGGSLFGLIGGLGTKILGIWEAKENRKARAEEMKHEVELRKIEGQLKKEETEQELLLDAQATEGDLRKSVVAGEYAGLVESIRADKEKTGISWIDGIRGMVRPSTLLFLAGFTVLIYSTTRAADVSTNITDTILGLLTTTVLWYFGSRDYSKFKIFGK